MDNYEIDYKRAAEQLRKGEPLFGKDGALAPMLERILNNASWPWRFLWASDRQKARNNSCWRYGGSDYKHVCFWYKYLRYQQVFWAWVWYQTITRPIMLRKRYIIKCINELLKNKANLVHSRHRSIHNFIMNLCSALTAYCFFDNKPAALPVYLKNQSS